MTSVVLAALAFIGIHVFISGTSLRGMIVARIGEKGFQGLFSLLSLGAVVWLCRAYSQVGYIALWGGVDALRPAALVLMLLAALLVTLGLTTPSPTAAGGEGLLDRPVPATGILRISRHPFLWGIAIWALTHLLLNGDAASFVLFGTFALVALIGPRLIDAKREARFGAKWEGFASVTSSVPFGAIVQGRNALRLGEIGWWRLGLGVVLYVAFLGTHRWLFGTSPFPL